MSEPKIIEVTVSGLPMEIVAGHLYFEHARRHNQKWMGGAGPCYKAGETGTGTFFVGCEYQSGPRDYNCGRITDFRHHAFGIEVVTTKGSWVIPKERVVTMRLENGTSPEPANCQQTGAVDES